MAIHTARIGLIDVAFILCRQDGQASKMWTVVTFYTVLDDYYKLQIYPLGFDALSQASGVAGWG